MNETARKRRDLRPWLVAAAMLGLGLLGGYWLSSRSIGNSPSATADPGISRPPMVLNLMLEGQQVQIVGNPVLADPASGSSTMIGEPAAKVTMVEFTDYLCGFCHQYTTQTFPKILEQYVKSGRLRYIVRNTISVGGDKTVAVAAIAACANEQGKFWRFHELAHGSATRWKGQSVPDLTTTLIDLGGGIGLDAAALRSCVTSNRDAQRYNTEVELSRRFGVTGTPSFIIGGYLFSGALPLEAFQKIFERLGV